MEVLKVEIKNKPKAPIIDADGNVYNLMGICSHSLKKAGYSEQAKEMIERIRKAKNYDEALAIMIEYIEPVDQYGKSFEESDDIDEDINI